MVLILLLFDAGEMWVGITLAGVLILLLFDAGEMWVGITLAGVLILLLFDAGEMWVGTVIKVGIFYSGNAFKVAFQCVPPTPSCRVGHLSTNGDKIVDKRHVRYPGLPSPSPSPFPPPPFPLRLLLPSPSFPLLPLPPLNS